VKTYIFWFKNSAGTFKSSDSPIEARNLKENTNETISKATLVRKSPDAQSKQVETTTPLITTESTLSPVIITTKISLPAKSEIAYGEHLIN
jgi:hypothetical protein